MTETDRKDPFELENIDKWLEIVREKSPFVVPVLEEFLDRTEHLTVKNVAASTVRLNVDISGQVPELLHGSRSLDLTLHDPGSVDLVLSGGSRTFGLTVRLATGEMAVVGPNFDTGGDFGKAYKVDDETTYFFDLIVGVSRGVNLVRNAMKTKEGETKVHVPSEGQRLSDHADLPPHHPD